jgi:hypothetical protein
MASKLFNMLSDLAKDAKIRDKFKKDPDAVMTEYGLSDAQKKALNESMKQGKHDSFHKAMKDEANEHFSDPDMLLC